MSISENLEHVYLTIAMYTVLVDYSNCHDFLQLERIYLTELYSRCVHCVNYL